MAVNTPPTACNWLYQHCYSSSGIWKRRTSVIAESIDVAPESDDIESRALTAQMAKASVESEQITTTGMLLLFPSISLQCTGFTSSTMNRVVHCGPHLQGRIRYHSKTNPAIAAGIAAIKTKAHCPNCACTGSYLTLVSFHQRDRDGVFALPKRARMM